MARKTASVCNQRWCLSRPKDLRDSLQRVVAWTEQGLLAELARQYFELLSWHDAAAYRLRYNGFVDYIGFRHSAELFTYLAVESHATTDFQGELRSLFGRFG